MFARVMSVQVAPGKAEEAIAVFRDSVIPAAKKQKGFVKLMLLTDRKAGKGVIIGLWETEADLRANEASGYLQQQTAKFAGLFVAPPTREEYEISVQS